MFPEKAKVVSIMTDIRRIGRTVPGPGYKPPRSAEAPLPYDSRMEMRAGEWEWRTLYFRGRHPWADAAEFYDPSTGLTLLGDLVFLYSPVRVVLMVILRFELSEEEFAEVDRWLVGQLDNGDRESFVEYFQGSYLIGWSGPPLNTRES